MQSINQMQRHVGRDIRNGSNIIVVQKMLADHSDLALVVYLDSIPMVHHDEILILVQSAEGQVEEDFGTAMYKKMYGNDNMLSFFHRHGFLKPVAIQHIELLPMPNRPIKLETIVNEMRKARGLPALSEMVQNSETVPNEVAQEVSKPEPIVEMVQDKVAVAKTYLDHADMLEKQAAAKRKEAYKLAPSLKPKVRKKTKK